MYLSEKEVRSHTHIHTHTHTHTHTITHTHTLQVSYVCNIAKVKPTINEIELHPFLAQKKFVAWCASMVSEGSS